MRKTKQEMDVWRSIMTNQEKEELIKFNRSIASNHDRQPVKITIEFQHKRFSDNTGSAIIDLPKSKGHVVLNRLHEAIVEITNELNK